jgi:hypothetical protein
VGLREGCPDRRQRVSGATLTNNALADRVLRSLVGNDEHRASALKGQRVGDIEGKRPHPFGRSLGGNQETRGARMPQDGLGDAATAGIVFPPFGCHVAGASRRFEGGFSAR